MESFDFLEKNKDKLKCIKCESKEDLVPYVHRKKYVKERRRRYTTYGYKNANVIACSKCEKEFRDWRNKYEDKLNPTICLVCPLFIFLGVLASMVTLTVPLFFIIVIPSLTAIILLSFRRKFKKSNPHKYIKISGNSVYVRSQNSSTWTRFDIWVKNCIENHPS